MPIVALYVGCIRSQVPLDEYIKDIGESLREAYDGTLKGHLTEDGLEKLQLRLGKLLKINTLHIVAKANDVLLEHAQTFAKARIVSDIRPVFGESVKEKPPAAVIMHLLNITFYNGGKRKELSVALDVKDIGDVIGILERAQSKAEQLRSIISSSGMTYIDVE